MASAEAENIRVAVRCRPMSKKEINEQAESCFVCKNGNAVLTNPENKDEVHEFGFDFVYPCETEQSKVFVDFGQPVLQRAFGGYNGTIFAYGQTGSGKTFSMAGISGNEELEGLIPRMNKALFEHVLAEKTNSPNKLFLVECSFFEIYNEIIYDLLDSSPSKDKKNKGLEIKEHSVLGIYVKDLQERVVESREEVLDLMAQGQANRTVGYTNMNSESSRSHSIFVIKIHQKDSLDESKNVFAKVNLVDLAGSERAAGTGAVGTRLKEGANINKSLSALGNVINALVEDARTGKKSFIPYRNSKLTRVLQESLGGNSLCSMLATLSPANINFIETLGTLKYASRAKSIKVNAKKNEEASQISQLNEEIAALKKRLMEQQSTSVDPVEKSEIIARFEKQIQEMDAVRLQTWEDKAKLSKQHELERKKLAKEKARADQKTQEEKVKKWKLLEAKADIELAMRATRELDVGEDGWIAMAAKAKALEQDVKDARTLICVFKDSLDKDVVAWKASDDDASSVHVTANQLCTKIKNIQEESAKMMALESELLRQTSAIVDAIATEIDKLHGNWTASLGGTPPPSKEAKLAYEDRDKALSITQTMVQTYRAALLAALKAERKRIFNFHDAARLMSNELQAQVDSAAMPDDRKKARAMAIKSLAGALEACANVDAAPATAAPTEFVPKGDRYAFGLEKRMLADDRLTASSGDAKGARLHSVGCWAGASDDAAPWLKIDLEKPRFVDAIALQGGVLGLASSDEPALDLSRATMTAVQAQFPPESVSGDHEQTYEIAKHIMSWVKLLKSPQVPVKLFSRPPVRFLHDVITQVAINTGYGKDVLTERDRDYNQLAEKKDKVEYLVKVIALVQASFQGVVEVKATDANILAGKEPEQTMHFLGLFCLGAVRHLAATAPDTPARKEGWVTALDVATSVDGDTWVSAPFDGCTDVASVVSIALPPHTIARYLKLLPTKWHEAPALRCEVFGFAASSNDSSLDSAQAEILSYLGLLTNLFSAGELVLEEARVKWTQAKDSQREKQTALNNLVQEIDTWRAQTQALKADLEAATKAAEKWKSEKIDGDHKLQAATTAAASTAAQFKATEEELAQAKGAIDTLTTQCAELAQTNDSAKQAQLQLQAQLASMTQSKADLEKLNEGLRAQLSSKSALEGATDSRMASLSAELQTMTIQFDEAKRNLERTAKALTDAETEKATASTHLKELKLEATAKDRRTEALEASYKAQLADLQQQHAVAQASLQESIGRQTDLEAQLQKAATVATGLQTELDATKKRLTDSATAEFKRLQDEAGDAEKRCFALQTQQVRLQADNDRLEAKYAAADEKLKALELRLAETGATIEALYLEKKQLEEQEEELTLQLQVVTEERDSARQKEEILFFENAEKDQEIERIRDGYVWVTDRMNNKEDELAELQEQIEKYQSLLRLSTGESQSRPSSSQAASSCDELQTLYRLAFGKDASSGGNPLRQLTQWIQTKAAAPQEPMARNASAPKATPKTPREKASSGAAGPSAQSVKQPEMAVSSTKPTEATFVTQPDPESKSTVRAGSVEDLSPPVHVEVRTTMGSSKSVTSEVTDDNEYDDDFDAADDDDGVKRGKSKRRITADSAAVEPVTAKVLGQVVPATGSNNVTRATS
ncbi:kinesin-like protein [Achlya hypogyna]|uniref:Kinesin-like protein n=1 Tax=Achlya hypogyna TaxID=1202772 RepID=A0A1V9ZU70_ACHHY|nr:kinesin-like protein [Achlya hypogyna]